MGYTPRTWLAGEEPTAAELNAEVRDQVQFLRNPPIAFLYANATQTVPSASPTLITINTASVDPYTALNASTHAWVVPTGCGGIYEVDGHIHWTGATGGSRAAWLTTDMSGLTAITGTEGWAQPGSGPVTADTSGQLILTAGQSVALVGYQSTATGLATVGTSNAFATLRLKYLHD